MVLGGHVLPDPWKSREGMERQAGLPFRPKKSLRPVYDSRPQQETDDTLRVVESKEGIIKA